MIKNVISELEMIYYDDKKILKNIPLKTIVFFVDFPDFRVFSLIFVVFHCSPAHRPQLPCSEIQRKPMEILENTEKSTKTTIVFRGIFCNIF